MGKSPGKWIKTLLFGKKSSRSHAPKTGASAAKGKDWNGGKGEPALAVDSTVISEQVSTKTDANARDTEIENKAQSDLASGLEITLPWQEGADKQGSIIANVSTDPGRAREEQAAIKAQAAFRGYLARRAFRALKGIIRLQALIRGHLVRRQAVATLHCMWGIVKLQALVRGRRVRHGIRFEVKRGSHLAKDVKHVGSFGANVSSWKGKAAANAYVCKLLSSSTLVKPLDSQYNMEESNSVWSWLERWTFSMFWKPPPQPKKVLDSKPQGKHYARETESGRSKRSVRKNFGANIEPGLNNVSLESEKPKRNLRKVSSHPAEPVQDNPQSELERVKRNLRKVSNPIAEASDWVEVDMEKPKRSMQKLSNPSDNLDLCVGDTTEKMQKAVANLALETKSVETVSKHNVQKVKNSSETDQGAKETAENVMQDIPLIPTMSHNVETSSALVLPDGAVDTMLESSPVVERNPPQDMGKVERFATVNGEEYSSKEEDAYHENQKSSKRSSFSARLEYTDNGLQSTPKLPSYMAATESAKAKLRGQNSPRCSSDEVEKNGFTRRHSLPSSTNGKSNSLSPRTQRLVQASRKGGLRSDRSLLSSRDGNDKPIHVEWRR